MADSDVKRGPKPTALSVFQALAGAIRNDGWINTVTGLGTSRDKSTYTSFQRGAKLCDEELDALYGENDMAARICDALPEDAARRGFRLKIETSDDRERKRQQGLAPDGEDSAMDTPDAAALADDIMEDLREKEALAKLVEARVWGRVFGWGAVLLGVNDGQDLSQPLNLDRVRDFTHLTVLDKQHAVPLKWYEDVTAPKAGRPETYLVTSHAIVQGPTAARLTGAPLAASRRRAALDQYGVREIHESRMIIFGGVRTTVKRRRENTGFDDPLLQRVDEVLRKFGVAWDSLEHILQDGYQGVYKVKGFIDALAMNNPSELQTRFGIMDMARSVIRSVIVDADAEEFERQQLTLTGLPDTMDRFAIRLSAAAGMPVTRLMGQSPAGLNATGESDMRMWHERVEYEREYVLEPAVRRLVEIQFAVEGGAPDSWSIEWPPLASPTDAEAAQMRKTQAETDKIYYDMGVATESEIALSRFGADGWSPETTIDIQARRDMLEDELDELANPPEPPPALPGAAPVPPSADAGESVDR